MSVKIIDSFFVALGFKPDTAGLEAFQKKAEGARDTILSWRTSIGGLIAGLGVAKIAKIGSEFEQNRIAIAGFLSALGVSSDFNAGLKDAADTIQQITLDAAKLPGEAEEYVEVFKAALPFVKAAIPGGGLQEFTAFTNQVTAIGKTLGVDAPQIGRDLQLMLGTTGRAGGHVKLFQQLMPFLRNVKGQAQLTSQTFNAMTAPKRLELMQEAFKTLQPMLDESANSFDAMFGAAKSSFTQITRFATAGLFASMKNGLNKLNAVLFTSEGKLTDFGQTLVDNTKTMIRWATQLATAIGSLVVWIGKLAYHSGALKVVLVALAPVLAGLAFTKAAAGVARLVGGLGKMRAAILANRLLVGGLVIAIALLAEDLYQFYNGGESVTGMLVKKWAPAIYLIKAALGLLAAALLRTQVVALATGARIAVAWLIGLGPIGLVIAAIGVLVAAFFLIREHWDEIVAGMKKTWEGFIESIKSFPRDIKLALGFGKEEDVAAGRDRMASRATTLQHILNPGSFIADKIRDAFSNRDAPPAASMSGAEAMGSGGFDVTNNISTTTNVAKIEVNGSSDPRATAEAVQSKLDDTTRRATRNAQSGTAL